MLKNNKKSLVDSTVSSLLSPIMYRFVRHEGIVYVLDNNNRMATKEEVSEIVQELSSFLEEVDSDFIEEHNDSLLDGLFNKEHYPEQEEKKPKERPGYVYLIEADNGLIKIGRTRNIKERWDHFTTKLPYELKMIHSVKTNDYVKLERELHEKFSEHRKNGEWFSLSGRQVSRVKKQYQKKYNY